MPELQDLPTRKIYTRRQCCDQFSPEDVHIILCDSHKGGKVVQVPYKACSHCNQRYKPTLTNVYEERASSLETRLARITQYLERYPAFPARKEYLAKMGQALPQIRNRRRQNLTPLQLAYLDLLETSIAGTTPAASAVSAEVNPVPEPIEVPQSVTWGGYAPPEPPRDDSF